MQSYMIMMLVKIAELKSKLSNYLKRVRAGEEIVVTDRETPIARLLPYQQSPQQLRIHKAHRPPSDLKKMQIVKLGKKSNSLAALQAMREDDLDPS